MADAPRPRAALVTGGAGGVGRAVARRLLAAGHDVALLGRTEASVEAVAREMSSSTRRVVAVAADVSDRAGVEAALETVHEALGPVTLLVNAAGIAESGPLLPPDDALFDVTMAVNVRGAWVVSTAVLPDMVAERFGRIVHVASTAALQGFRFTAAYVASKHALLGLTRAMAKDVEGKGITVNAVCPGFLDTPMTERTIARIIAATGRTRAQALSDVLKTGAQERLIPPEQVADAVLSLFREEASTVTGAAVPV